MPSSLFWSGQSRRACHRSPRPARCCRSGRGREMSDSVRRGLCESVDGTVLMGHMHELARWVKLSGTPDELQSLRYFQVKLDGYGYRTDLTMHDAYISLPGTARVDVDNQALASITHSFSRSSPAPGVT